MLMEKIALKVRFGFLLPLIIVDAFHIECILYGNLANIQHTTQVTCWSIPDYLQYNVVTQSIQL